MRSANQQQIPHNLPGQSARNAANYQSLGRRAELGIYAKLFPWICIAAAIVTGAPALILDPDSGIYSQKLAISSGFVALFVEGGKLALVCLALLHVMHDAMSPPETCNPVVASLAAARFT